MRSERQMIFKLDVVGRAFYGFGIDFFRKYTAKPSIGSLCFLGISGGNIELLCAKIFCFSAGEAEELSADAHSAMVGGNMKQRDFDILLCAAEAFCGGEKVTDNPVALECAEGKSTVRDGA